MGLDGVELLMAIEEAFDLTITDDEAGTIATVGDLHAFLMRSLTASGRSPDPDAVFRTIRALVCDQLAVAPERVVPGAHFVRDLRMD